MCKIPEVSDLTFRRVAQDGYGHGLAMTVTRHTWQAVKPDGDVLTGGQRTRKACEEAAAEVIELAKSLVRSDR